MKRDEMVVCAKCIYFDEPMEQCRRYAPKPSTEPVPQHWKNVRRDHWCGEWVTILDGIKVPVWELTF